jgi:glyoxylate reductase
MLQDKRYEVDINPENKVLTKNELIKALLKKPYDAVFSLLTDKIDEEVIFSCPTVKLFANYAVGYDNIDIKEAEKRGVIVTNTPDCLTDTVAEHTVAMLLALTTKIVEGNSFVKSGKYEGWDPLLLLGTDLKNKIVGILGAGRIGQRVASILANGFNMNIIYYDISRNEQFEEKCKAVFYDKVDEILKIADFVSVHTPLLDSTRHLINLDRLKMMKNTAFLVNTSRGAVINEEDLVEALQKGLIAGAGLDVYENEPRLSTGLKDLPNVILTPHIASATIETRNKMAEIVANNIIDFFEGRTPRNKIG